MKCLARNKQPFYYALFKEKIEQVDDYGNSNGEYQVVYDEPIKAMGNISSATGTAQLEQFGNNINYDKVIILDEMNSLIDENSVLCVDCLPTYDETNNLIYDYVVKKVAKSLNTVAYAISKVKIS